MKKNNKKTITDDELNSFQATVWNNRKKLSKKSIGFKLWMSISSGEELTVKDASEKYNKSDKEIRRVLKTLWKRGYMLSPIVDKEGNVIISPSRFSSGAIIKDILEKKEYLIGILRRQRKLQLLPSIKKMVLTCEAGAEAFPEIKGKLIDSLDEDKKNLIELYDNAEINI